MARLLYLVHRIPFPPDKGDKVRSYHLLRQLLTRHEVFLGTFADDEADLQHVDRLRSLCAQLHVARLHPRTARLRSIAALVHGRSMTQDYYADDGLAAWVRRIVQEHRITTAVVFSSSMAQYVDSLPGIDMVVDFVDVDSAKWAEYALARRWPMSWLYRRESERLLAYERQTALRARRSFFVTEQETGLFGGLAPECVDRIEPMNNGVDASYFEPAPGRASPYRPGELAVVFTGAMDYWPNVDAAEYFATQALPLLQRDFPTLRFHIVGRSPASRVLALAGERVNVTGTVPDVRPYLQHAAVVVAPLRLARGIQNKVLEAMAMARPVVASAACARAIDARPGIDIVPAAEAADFAREIARLLRDPALASRIGSSGRQRVLERYSWPAHLGRIERHLQAQTTA